MSEQDEIIATHEAAHALACVAFGLTLDRVQICDNDPRFVWANTPRHDQRIAQILCLMAGGEAESVFFNRAPIGDAGDSEKIRTLLWPCDDEQRMRREVRLWIAGNCPAILRVADALKRRGVLTGDEVARLVRANVER
jgi:hypothetical protein